MAELLPWETLAKIVQKIINKGKWANFRKLKCFLNICTLVSKLIEQKVIIIKSKTAEKMFLEYLLFEDKLQENNK